MEADRLTGRLGGIHRGVRGEEHVGAVLGVQRSGGDADAGLHVQHQVLQQHRVREALLHCLGTGHRGVLRAGLGEDDRELVPTQPREGVRRPQSFQRLREALHDSPQQVVADAVTVGVVDLLEVVQVDQRQREAVAVLGPRTGEQPVDLGVERAPVGDPGELVGAGHLADRGELSQLEEGQQEAQSAGRHRRQRQQRGQGVLGPGRSGREHAHRRDGGHAHHDQGPGPGQRPLDRPAQVQGAQGDQRDARGPGGVERGARIVGVEGQPVGVGDVTAREEQQADGPHQQAGPAAQPDDPEGPHRGGEQDPRSGRVDQGEGRGAALPSLSDQRSDDPRGHGGAGQHPGEPVQRHDQPHPAQVVAQAEEQRGEQEGVAAEMEAEVDQRRERRCRARGLEVGQGGPGQVEAEPRGERQQPGPCGGALRGRHDHEEDGHEQGGDAEDAVAQQRGDVEPGQRERRDIGRQHHGHGRHQLPHRARLPARHVVSPSSVPSCVALTCEPHRPVGSSQMPRNPRNRGVRLSRPT